MVLPHSIDGSDVRLTLMDGAVEEAKAEQSMGDLMYRDENIKEDG